MMGQCPFGVAVIHGTDLVDHLRVNALREEPISHVADSLRIGTDLLLLSSELGRTQLTRCHSAARRVERSLLHRSDLFAGFLLLRQYFSGKSDRLVRTVGPQIVSRLFFAEFTLNRV